MNYREWISFRRTFDSDGYGLYFCKTENGKSYYAKPITLDYVEQKDHFYPGEPTLFVPRMKIDMLHRLVDDLNMQGIGGVMIEGIKQQDSARKDHISSLEGTIGKLINMTVALK